MFRHARRAVAAVLLTLLVIASATGPVAANFPGRNGQIVFQRFDADGNWQIWVANPDLSHQRQITFGPSDNSFPAWSPDGSRIAFQSHRTDPDPTDEIDIQEIFTMRPDGSDVRQITDLASDTEKPGWSPDGRWLLFASSGADYPRSMGIYIVRSNGSGAPRRLTRLSGTSFWQELARFSPDGKAIEYTEYRPAANPDEPEESALIIARADGSHPRQITPWELRAVDADWSPDGRRLVFASRLASRDFIQSIMVVDADGRHPRELTDGDGLTCDGDDLSLPGVFQFRLVTRWEDDPLRPGQLYDRRWVRAGPDDDEARRIPSGFRLGGPRPRAPARMVDTAPGALIARADPGERPIPLP